MSSESVLKQFAGALAVVAWITPALAVLYVRPKLPENEDAAVAYRRVRSTSSDVDEGDAPVKPVPPR